MAKADLRAAAPRTERLATIAADYYPPLSEQRHAGDRIIRVMQGCLMITAE